MNNTLLERTDLYASNVGKMKRGFLIPHTLVKNMAALVYTGENRVVDVEAVRACHKLIKENASMVSYFRGNLAVSIAALLSLQADPERQLQNTLTVYKLMKQYKFHASDHLAVAAYHVALECKDGAYEPAVQRARAFYDAMKKAHILLTGKDDYIFACMMALSDLDVAEGAAHLEALYQGLKPEFRNANSIQTLAQVLVLTDDTNGAVQRVHNLREEFRARGRRMDRQYVLSCLGVLAMLPGTEAEIADDVVDVFNELRGRTGFGIWSLSNQELLLFSAGIVAGARCALLKDGAVQGTITTSITNIILAQEMALIAIIATSASSSAAASSSGGGSK